MAETLQAATLIDVHEPGHKTWTWINPAHIVCVRPIRVLVDNQNGTSADGMEIRTSDGRSICVTGSPSLLAERIKSTQFSVLRAPDREKP